MLSKSGQKQQEYIAKKEAEIQRLSGEVLRLKLLVDKLRAENATLRQANERALT